MKKFIVDGKLVIRDRGIPEFHWKDLPGHFPLTTAFEGWMQFISNMAAANIIPPKGFKSLQLVERETYWQAILSTSNGSLQFVSTIQTLKKLEDQEASLSQYWYDSTINPFGLHVSNYKGMITTEDHAWEMRRTTLELVTLIFLRGVAPQKYAVRVPAVDPPDLAEFLTFLQSYWTDTLRGVKKLKVSLSEPLFSSHVSISSIRKALSAIKLGSSRSTILVEPSGLRDTSAPALLDAILFFYKNPIGRVLILGEQDFGLVKHLTSVLYPYSPVEVKKLDFELYSPKQVDLAILPKDHYLPGKLSFPVVYYQGGE